MSRLLREALFLCSLTLLPAGGSALLHRHEIPWRPDALRPGEISLQEALSAREPLLWVDARPRSEYERGRIPEAMLLNEEEWDARVTAVLDRWQPGQRVVVYCDSGACRASHAVAERLREFRMGPVFVLQGGWERWKRSRESAGAGR